MKKHLLSIRDVSAREVEELVRLARDVKRRPQAFKARLQGKTLALLFEKPSMRTIVSFQVAMHQLGGDALVFGSEDYRLGKREALEDEARVLARYVDGAVLRTFSQDTLEQFARHFDKPLVNGLSDVAHPAQALSDYLTLSERWGNVRARTVAFVGDANNVFRSLLLLFAKTGGRFRFAVPRACAPPPALLKEAQGLARSSGARLEAFGDPHEAVRGADAVYTDVWVSMGEERAATRKRKHLKGYRVDAALMRRARPGALFMHCLPAHRGEEVTQDVMSGRQSVVYEQAENRLHMQKSILLTLL